MERHSFSGSLYPVIPHHDLNHRSISLSEKSSNILKRDILTVFQAAPLAYYDLDGNLWPIGMLDFDLEREIVTDAVKEAQSVDAKIDVAFETATTDRLGAFLAKSESQILHFSCHGHPDYLFIEDGWGAGQQLLLKDLKEWISDGGSNLRFVFVSACHSRSAGEAFLAAGVPHVVCCQQDSQQVRNTAAVEFARAFYRALACRKTLKEAFDLARHHVGKSPVVEDAQNEMNKFALLPEKADHNVPIFFANPLPNTFTPKALSPPKRFPVPPQTFVGRDVDMYRVLDAVRYSRIVRVTGQPGTGKCSLVKAVCRYIFNRHLMDDIFWLPVGHEAHGDGVVTWLSKLFEEFQSGERRAYNYEYDDTYRKCRDGILGELREKKVLIIIDARKFFLTEGMKKLITFLEDLFQGTSYTKVIVVHSSGDKIRSKNFSCREADIELKPLDFESSVSLFSNLCQHMSNPDDLFDPLAEHRLAGTPAASLSLSHRTSEVHKMLGKGIPAKICDIAKRISPSEYEELISVAKRPIPDAFKHRAALEKAIEKLEKEIEQAVQRENYHHAREIQKSLSEIEMLRETFPDLETLRMMADGLQSDLQQAVEMRDYTTAAELQKELDLLSSKIRLEEDALRDNQSYRHTENRGTVRNSLCYRSRADLEASIRECENDLKLACDNRDFLQARWIDRQLIPLKRRREKLPTSDELSAQFYGLMSQLNDAMEKHDWEAAETLDRKLADVEKKLKIEKDAQAEILGASNASDREKETSSIGAQLEKKAETCPQDPPGLYAQTLDCHGEDLTSRPEILHQNSSSSLPFEFNRGEDFDEESVREVRPGAFAVRGPDYHGHDDDSSFLEPPWDGEHCNLGTLSHDIAASNEEIFWPGALKSQEEFSQQPFSLSATMCAGVNDPSSRTGEAHPRRPNLVQGKPHQTIEDTNDSPSGSSVAYSLLDGTDRPQKSQAVESNNEAGEAQEISLWNDSNGIEAKQSDNVIDALKLRTSRVSINESRQNVGESALETNHLDDSCSETLEECSTGPKIQQEQDQITTDANDVSADIPVVGNHSNKDVHTLDRNITVNGHEGDSEARDIPARTHNSTERLRRESSRIRFQRSSNTNDTIISGVAAVGASELPYRDDSITSPTSHGSKREHSDRPNTQQEQEQGYISTKAADASCDVPIANPLLVGNHTTLLESNNGEVQEPDDSTDMQGHPSRSNSASAATDLRQARLGLDEAIFPELSVMEIRKQMGLCHLCGTVKTHRRKRVGLRFKWEPTTTIGENDEYTVYKGYCLGPHCFTIDCARRHIGEEPFTPKPQPYEDEPTLPITLPDATTASVQVWEDPLPAGASTVQLEGNEDSRSSRIIEDNSSHEQEGEGEKDERARIEVVVRDILSGMTVTAADVQTISKIRKRRSSKGLRLSLPKAVRRGRAKANKMEY